MMATPANVAGAGNVLGSETDGVITSAKAIDDIVTELKAAFETLKAEGDEVIKGSWTGTAAEKISNGWHEWQDGMKKVAAALEDATSLVAGAARSFRSVDER